MKRLLFAAAIALPAPAHAGLLCSMTGDPAICALGAAARGYAASQPRYYAPPPPIQPMQPMQMPQRCTYQQFNGQIYSTCY